MLNDVLSEQLVCGLMIQKEEAAYEGVSSLTLEHFSDPNYRILFDAITALVKKNQKINTASVTSELKFMGSPFSFSELEVINNQFYSPEKLKSLIEVLEDRKQRRDVLSSIDSFKKKVSKDSTPVSELIRDFAFFDNHLFSSKSITPENYLEYTAQMDAEYVEKEIRKCYIPDIDDVLTYGFSAGEISIITARPSNGKSALKTNFINNMCSHGIGVVNYALEQTLQVETDRLESLVSGIPLSELAAKRSWYNVDKEKYNTLIEARKTIAGWNYYLIEGINKSILQIKNELKVLSNRGIKVVFFDLFDRLRDVNKNVSNKANNVGSVLQSVLEMAKELELHICLLVQINREFEKKGKGGATTGNKPTIAQLKDSGAYEEYARLIFITHYPKFYNPELQENVLEVEIAKQSNGPKKGLKLRFDNKTLKVTTGEISKGVLANRSINLQKELKLRKDNGE